MRLSWYRARFVEKPIRGFGWRGWLATAVFFGILIPHLAGFDWQFFLMKSLWALAGKHFVFPLVIHMSFIQMSLTAPTFSLVAVLLLVPLMRSTPVRFGWWRYLLLFGASIAGSCVVYWVRQLGIDATVLPSSTWVIFSLMIGSVATLVATNSLAISISWLAMVPLAVLQYPILLNTPLRSVVIPTSQWWGSAFDLDLVSVAVQLIPTAVAVWWAIRLRKLLVAPGQCVSCGYALSGNVSGFCPECGKPIEVSETEETPVTPTP